MEEVPPCAKLQLVVLGAKPSKVIASARLLLASAAENRRRFRFCTELNSVHGGLPTTRNGFSRRICSLARWRSAAFLKSQATPFASRLRSKEEPPTNDMNGSLPSSAVTRGGLKSSETFATASPRLTPVSRRSS